MPLSVTEITEIERAALLGTRRRPLPVPASMAPLIGDLPAGRQSLALLALAGQRRRLGARPGLNAPAAAIESAPEDTRPILPDPTRSAFRRFIGVAAPSPDLHFSNALAAVLNLSGLRLHPYDLPHARKLEALSTNHGPFETWWLGQTGARSGGIAIQLRLETWGEIRPSVLRDSMRAWRGRAPAAARKFAQEIFSDGSSEQRTALVEAFDVGAGPDDASFLEQVATDKSAKVREAAERISAYVPGLPAYREIVERIAATLIIKKKGRPSKRVTISVNEKEFQALTWSESPRVRLSDLAAALEIAVEDLTNADLMNVRATAAMFTFAAWEGRIDLCEKLLMQTGSRARACLGASHPLPGTVPLALRRRLIAPLLDPSVYREAPENRSETALALLHVLGGPLDGETIRRAAAAEGFSKSCNLLLERADSADTWAPRGEVIGIAALTPPEAADAVLEAVRPLEPLSTQKDLRSMFAYLNFLADLAKAGIRVSDDPKA